MPESSAQTRFRGVPIYMDGQTWVVPSLSVRQYREHEDALRTASAQPSFDDQVKTMLPVIRAALGRNYPDVTEEQLLDMLDATTYFEVVRAVAGASGLKEKEQAPGE